MFKVKSHEHTKNGQNVFIVSKKSHEGVLTEVGILIPRLPFIYQLRSPTNHLHKARVYSMELGNSVFRTKDNFTIHTNLHKRAKNFLE